MTSIRTKILTLVLVLSVIPSIAIGFILYHRLDTGIRQQTTHLTRDLMQQSLGYLELYLDQVAQMNATVTASDEVQRVLSTESFGPGYESLQAFRDLARGVESVAKTRTDVVRWEIYGNNGLSYLNGVPGFGIPEGFRDASWYARLHESDSPDVWSYDSTSQALLNARTVNHLPSGTVLGYSTVYIPLYQIQSVLRSFNRDRAGFLALIEAGSGTLAGQLAPPDWVTKAVSHIEPGEHLTAGLGPDEQFLMFSEALIPQELRVAMFIPRTELLEALQNLPRDLVLVFTVVLIITALVWWRFASRLTAPLAELTHTMEQFQEGATDIRAPVRSNDEVGELARSYNAMLDRLNRLVIESYEEQMQRRDAEWAALQAQINPHFLNNTLNSIASMARAGDMPEITQMVTALSRLFQGVLQETGKWVTLHSELYFAQQYLRIQKIRFRDRLETRIDVDERDGDFFVPRFILQPIVENAIVHGIEPQQSGGCVAIAAELSADALNIWVSDDGKGMEAETVTKIMDGSQGKSNRIGLWNVDQRIKRLAGSAFGLAIDSAPGEGSTVRLKLPVEYGTEGS